MAQSFTSTCEDTGRYDFDYIGTGGFVIVCGENVDNTLEDNSNNDSQALGITRGQADLLFRNCPFFRKCFNIPDNTEGDEGDFSVDTSTSGIIMKEAQHRIIYKPDWSLAIARHFVEVITKGKTAVPSLELYEQLMNAGDQALVDFRLTSMVNYMDPCSKNNNFLRLVEPRFYCFRFNASVTSTQWLALLDRDILLYRQETNYVVQLYKDRALDKDKAQSRRNLDMRRSEFLVHADRPIEAILEIQKCLAGQEVQDSTLDPSAETFSIYFETTDPIPQDHHELIDRLAGGEAYIRTCADAAEYQTEGYTVRASLDVLARSIRPVIESSVTHCSFRVDNPSPDTLGRFINACQQAEVHPSTLGMDSSINRYFCRKSMGDIKMVLNYMADYGTKASVAGDFQLFELSSEDQPF